VAITYSKARTLQRPSSGPLKARRQGDRDPSRRHDAKAVQAAVAKTVSSLGKLDVL